MGSAIGAGVSGATSSLKVVAFVVIWLGVALGVYIASVDPRSAVRRVATAYAAGLDARLRSLFMPARGVQIAWTQACGAIALVATYVFVPTPVLLCLAFAALVAPKTYLGVLVRRRRRRIDDQVNGFTLALSNALKTTASLGEALHVTLDVSANPLRQELEMALKQVRVGSGLDEALLAMAARASAPALDIVVSTLLIGRQTGGDLPRILEGVAASLRELKRLEEMMEKTLSSAKQSVALAAAIVVGFAILLPRVMPGFFDPLRDTVQGQLVVVQCVVLFLLALFLAHRFTRTNI